MRRIDSRTIDLYRSLKSMQAAPRTPVLLTIAEMHFPMLLQPSARIKKFSMKMCNTPAPLGTADNRPEFVTEYGNDNIIQPRNSVRRFHTGLTGISPSSWGANSRIFGSMVQLFRSATVLSKSGVIRV